MLEYSSSSANSLGNDLVNKNYLKNVSENDATSIAGGTKKVLGEKPGTFLGHYRQ